MTRLSFHVDRACETHNGRDKVATPCPPVRPPDTLLVYTSRCLIEGEYLPNRRSAMDMDRECRVAASTASLTDGGCDGNKDQDSKEATPRNWFLHYHCTYPTGEFK